MRLRPLLIPALALGCVLTAGALSAPAALAQTNRNAGSVYSRFGVGERLSFASSQAEMMGGAAVAIRSGTYAGLANPALWSDQSLVQLSLGARVQGLRAEDATGEDARLTETGISGLQLSLPIQSNRIGATLAFRPYSRVSYLVVREGTIENDDLPDGAIDYDLNLEGDGGLQEVKLGVGWRLSQAVAVGASANALFGVIEDRQRTAFLSGGLGETRTTRRTQMWGFGATLGALVSARRLLGERDALSVGAALTLPTALELRRVRTRGISLDQDTLRTEIAGDATLPLQLQAGFSYLPNERWTLAADATYEPWSAFESTLALGGFAPAAGGEAAVDDLRDRLRLGGGFQFVPGGVDRTAGYFARTAYRLGGYYDRAFYAPGGEPLSTLAVTGGLSLPAVRPGTRFDLGFEAGTRGTTEAGLVRDLFIKATATINFGERWFVRRRFG